MNKIILVAMIILAVAAESGFAIPPAAYEDGRPQANLRLEARDQGVVLHHGVGPNQCDYLGSRDVWVWHYGGTYYMHYDGAGPRGWLTCLAVSKDLAHWVPRGPALSFGAPYSNDSASASYGTTYFDGRMWHMYYLGTPHATPAPDYVPAFPYLTMKAESAGPAGPWKKQYDVTPFRVKANTYYAACASPGYIIKQGGEYLMFFSASTEAPIFRTLGLARARDLNGPWTLATQPLLPPTEQIENSSLYFEKKNKTWFLFTNHVGIRNGLEYTDAIWVYWSKDVTKWDPAHKAVVLDSRNCKWSKHIIGLPSVVPMGSRLAIFYDGQDADPIPPGVKSHMNRDIGLAWLDLPLEVPVAPVSTAETQATSQTNCPQTFCNPLDLAYRFRLQPPSRREAADPTLVRYKGEYWLFASKSGGYWHSRDMAHWKFVEPTGLPLEDYAPTVDVLNGRMIFTAAGTQALYSTDDPLKGFWFKVADLKGYPDPDIFVDDNGRVYLYYGCSFNGSIEVVELDPQHEFKVVKGPVICFSADYAHHGWEVKGEENLGNPSGSTNLAPFIEGSWMNKHGGTYYLQYSAPGTEFKTYADGVYTATNPMGPFVYAPYSPFSHKPTGFIGGAGHSSTMEDCDGNYWHIVTMTISVRHMFERRLGLFPTGFMPDGQMICNTYLGDYPQFVPGARKNPVRNNSPGWMLLSYNKSAIASSTLEKFPVKNAFDENIRTWWSAVSGKPGEWLQVDLGKPCRIEAMQINFADQGMTNLGRMDDDSYRYYVQTSDDETNWQTCLDRSNNLRDSPHDYTQLDEPVTARYVRLVNVHMPGDGLFSVSGFRLFGNGLGKSPASVKAVEAVRNASDLSQIHVSWQPVKDADFYVIRYGIARDRLFNNYQVYGANQFNINSLNNSLNIGTSYYFTVDAVNDSGIGKGRNIIFVK